MQLDDRSSLFINELISNPNIKTKDLERKYNVTRRQVDYSMEKINYWLTTKNLPEIERTRQGVFVIDPVIIKTFLSNSEEEAVSKVLNSDDRANIILLILVSAFDELSIIHFTSELKVSKNTVLSDLKKAKDVLKEYNLAIHYSRKEGYLLKGKEFNIRKLLIFVIDQLLRLNNGGNIIEDISDMQSSEIEGIKKSIEKAENELNLKFTDEKIISMPYIFSIVLKRIQKGKVINQTAISYKELSDTREFLVTENLLQSYPFIPMVERLYITLHLLATNVYWSEQLTTDDVPDLRSAVDEMLLLFEKSACITIQNKDQLIEKLLLHIKPAYYRIKYRLTEVNQEDSLITKNLRELHHLVKKSVSPLARFIGIVIPDVEIEYLTMLIGGWLTKQGEKIEAKIKALVICPQGISVSRLMFGELKQLFPEFIFLDSLSIREFNNYPLNYDIVFSPVYLKTEKKLYITSTVLEMEEKIALRKQVMIDFHGVASQGFKIHGIKDIINKHATIHNEELLIRDLYNYINDINQVSTDITDDKPSYLLRDLINEATIQLVNHQDTWSTAIKFASEPLLKKGDIELRYVSAMIENCSDDPYIILGNGVAIPHASPEYGVNKTSMSLLSIKDGIHFSCEHKVNIIVIIAAVDKEQHLKALMQLMKLSNSKKDVKRIIEAREKESVKKIIEKYSKEK
ncbi:PTS sugar transporter subunit IIA [Halolactibacillus alkaliphilus]|uniref:Ascorbate-specific PTS system EIIA component n=1 Tax=Halolactibacillus alkaliphilus TaxID=442899 RepID=A0A511X3D4_9BACI|nr:BglG family transcription antiterminator [Halolactibacillus alkaliphilus]GEN57431.1 PTS sugar transporter subunit IIA [Halolactibacillus alkaliphilus]GGN68468.1 PTS sugar transporter subunit IIA [Halolactibacillus alkaliphilus]SFO94877.1 transcriptional antiterminator, BglG family [Halolactibacillus alkaliphilus]